MDEKAITSDLNRNDATRAYAAMLEKNNVELKNKKNEGFKVTKDPNDKDGKKFIAKPTK